MEEVEIIVKSRDGPKGLRTTEEKLKIKKIKRNVKEAIDKNKTFLNFLKENKIYGRYVKNTVNNISKIPYREDFILKSIRNDSDPINYGFTWANTNENYNFWGINVVLILNLKIKNQFINHQNFKIMAETTANAYNVENAMKNQEENQNKVAKDAVQMAKENIAKRKLEEESRKVESRLQEASRQEDRALKELRVNRKKEAAAKKYLEDINAAKSTFESTGDWRKYDADVEKAAEERDKSIETAKREIYGDDYWRY